MKKLILFVSILISNNVSFCQDRSILEEMAYCKLGNINSYKLMIEPEKENNIQKFIPNYEEILELLNYTIPSLKEKEQFSDCILAFHNNVYEDILNNGDKIYYGDLELLCVREVKIESVDCKLISNLVPVWEIQSHFYTINQDNTYIKKMFWDLISDLINKFSIEYYKAN